MGESDRCTVGVVGAGQLARLMVEAADEATSLVVLATSSEEPAAQRAPFELGSSVDRNALRALAARSDVVTFDHELVNLEDVTALEAEGVTVRPSSAALRYAVDKSFQRERLAEAGIAVPNFRVVRHPREIADALAAFAGPVVVKLARGGYDGRGVFFPDERVDALVTQLLHDGPVVVEERLDLRAEYAQVLVVSVAGETVAYPLVRTIQADGMCVETQYPSGLDDELAAQIERESRRVAALVAPVGVLAVEWFLTSRGPLVNELALRPHNTAHWTIEGTTAGQFLQHLRAVSGRPLAPVTPVRPATVMVNLVGGPAPTDFSVATETNVAVHDYAKTWRPARKLGHVTVLADTVEDAHVQAWEYARRIGSGAKEAR